MRDINISPCRWYLRIWDVDNNEWLCDHDDDALPYYGFDIRGGEVTVIQGMMGVYNAFAHGKEFIWEQSTGLKDKIGVEVYEGDILRWHDEVLDIIKHGLVIYDNGEFQVTESICNLFGCLCLYKAEVVGNIHENPELLMEKK